MNTLRRSPSRIDEPPRVTVLAAMAAVAFALTPLSGCVSKPKPPQPIASDAAATPTANASTDAAAGSLGETTFKVLPWQFADATGALVTTPNYRLYTTVTETRFLERLPHFYEQMLDLYTTALAELPRPEEPLTSYLFLSRRQWMDKTHEILPEQAEMFSNLGRGGFTTRGTSVLYYIDRLGPPRDTFAIAAHEGWHQYTQQTFRHQLPIWLEEGIATYMEGYRLMRSGEFQWLPWANGERWETLADAVRNGELIDLTELLTRTPQSFLNDSKDSLLVYYAQVWALTTFLAEGEEGKYRSALEEVLTDTAHGRLVGRMMAAGAGQRSGRRGVGGLNRVGPAVVREYFNPDLVEFETEYLRFVREVVSQRPSLRSGRR